MPEELNSILTELKKRGWAIWTPRKWRRLQTHRSYELRDQFRFGRRFGLAIALTLWLLSRWRGPFNFHGRIVSRAKPNRSTSAAAAGEPSGANTSRRTLAANVAAEQRSWKCITSFRSTKPLSWSWSRTT